MNEQLIQLLQIIGPACAVYVAIRVDLAVTKIRLDHLEAAFKEHRESLIERRAP